MTGSGLIDALGVPPAALVDRRVPKTVLVEHGAPTPGDKRHINDWIEELRWVAALKPTTVGVPEYRDAVREYLEIAVLLLVLRPEARETGRIVELVHRAVPYPVLLVTEDGPARTAGLSVAHKRWSQGEAGQTVLDGEVTSVKLDAMSEPSLLAATVSAFRFDLQPRMNMFTAYQGWMSVVIAFQAARITGSLTVASSLPETTERQAALREYERLEGEIARVRAAAGRERQMARRVEANQIIKQLEAAQAAARKLL